MADPIEAQKILQIVEGALLASDGPLTVANLVKLFAPGELDKEDGSKQIRAALKTLEEQASERGVELKRVATGYRYQVRQELSEWVSRLWDEKPPRYTRALLETLALIAYKQPVTRGDIEQVRGVSVSQNIIRTLLEREWIKVVGHKEVPGRPALLGTTKAFLDYFNLKALNELPPLAEIKALIEPTLVEEEPPPVPQPVELSIDGPEAQEDIDADSEVEDAGDDETGHGGTEGGSDAEVQAHTADVGGVEVGAIEEDDKPANTAEVVQFRTS